MKEGLKDSNRNKFCSGILAETITYTFIVIDFFL